MVSKIIKQRNWMVFKVTPPFKVTPVYGMIIKQCLVCNKHIRFQWPSMLPDFQQQNHSKTLGMFRKVSAACMAGKQAWLAFQVTYPSISSIQSPNPTACRDPRCLTFQLDWGRGKGRTKTWEAPTYLT